MKKTFLTLATSLLALLAVSSVSAVDITVENAAGKQLVPQNPQRVVVLDFSAVDSVRALGEKNKIVGLAKSVNIPDYLSEFKSENYVNLGSLKEPDFEKINDLNPDLIIATTRQKKVINRLKEIAPVFYMHTDYTKLYESFQQNVNALGQIFSKQDIAKEKLANLEQRMKSLAEKTKGKTALVTLVNESKVSVYGDVSRYAVVYNNFGFTPADNAIKSSTHGMSVGLKYILEKNPDYLFVIDRTAAITEKLNNAQKVLDNAIIKKTEAYKNDQIVYLNSINWYLTFGGLESMGIMIDEIENAIKK